MAYFNLDCKMMMMMMMMCAEVSENIGLITLSLPLVAGNGKIKSQIKLQLKADEHGKFRGLRPSKLVVHEDRQYWETEDWQCIAKLFDCFFIAPIFFWRRRRGSFSTVLVRYAAEHRSVSSLTWQCECDYVLSNALFGGIHSTSTDVLPLLNELLTEQPKHVIITKWDWWRLKCDGAT